MNNVLKILGVIVLALVLVGLLIGAGYFIGRGASNRQVILAAGADEFAYGPGQPGMMQNWREGTMPFGGQRMMPGQGSARGGRLGRMGDLGRMPMFGLNADVEPLTIDEARTAVEDFLAELDRDGLAVGEIMIFDNHAYAVIEDAAAGTGAFEVLVDPLRQVVHLEFGPSMMWNTVYGMHGSDPILGAGRMPGRMMGGFGPATAPTSDTPLTEVEARQKALAYLEQANPDRSLSATAESFPGYFTFEVETDGTPVSMLSVNAATGQVWYHSWHGTFIEMSE